MYRLSETNYRGTGCGKSARPGLWGNGEVTNRSTRNFGMRYSQKRMNKIHCEFHPTFENKFCTDEIKQKLLLRTN